MATSDTATAPTARAASSGLTAPHDELDTDAAASAVPAPPNGTLALTAAVLGGLGAVCALSVVWFFAAIPLGLAAVACALVDRRRRRAIGQDRPASAATVGLVLGVAVLPMALGAFLLIPRAEHVAERAASALQGGVREDLDSLERTTTRNVDSLDDTLTELVKETDRGFTDQLRALERSTAEDMRGMERTVRSSVDEADRANAAELERLEASLLEDVQLADARAASMESEMRGEIDQLIAEINQLEALYEQSQGGGG